MELTPILNSRTINDRVTDLKFYRDIGHWHADEEELESLEQTVATGSYLNEDWDLGEDMYRDDRFAQVYENELATDENGEYLSYSEIVAKPEVQAEFSPIEVLDAIYWIRCT